MYRDLATHPDWQRGARKRLIASLAIAGSLIATFIITTKFASDEDATADFQLTLKPPEKEEPPRMPEQPLEPVLIEEAERQLPALADLVEPAAQDVAPEEPEPVLIDWYAEMEKVASEMAAEDQKTWSVNPALDAKRRAAADQFRPSRAPVKKPIWENVEVDQLGRKILVHGDCHRVIDDPNVGSNEIFRTFGQYIVFCSNYKRAPQELPWVDEIRDRRVYLQPDPELRGAAGGDLVASILYQE